MEDKKWYNSAKKITNLIIGLILLIIICNQSFAFGKNGSLELFTSIINHNTIYLFVLIYFILLKIYVGKRYFNYLSVFLIFIYFITTITSLLTLIQVFSLNSVLDFILNSLLLIYLVHVLLRDTRVWREFYLSSSPFNELTNDFIFYSIVVVSIFLLAVNLINTVVISGVIISVLDTIFKILFSRYIYLYRDYLDKKKINIDNTGNFDVVRDKVQDVLDKTDIDEKIVAKTKEVKKKVDSYVKDKKIDKKVEKIKDKVVDTTKEIENKVNDIVVDTKKEINKKSSKKSTTKKKSTKKGDK
ncbi:MAG: hypothetical protein IJ097_01150 [Bacilli bacterium]|nr:hypothetical protein [Bacilli bacterium]